MPQVALEAAHRALRRGDLRWNAAVLLALGGNSDRRPHATRDSGRFRMPVAECKKHRQERDGTHLLEVCLTLGERK